MAARATELLVPRSAGEAAKAFGSGSGTTVLAGGTIVMPELVAGARPRRVLALGSAKLAGVTRKGGTVSIGSMTTIEQLLDADEPLATAARHVADLEIRGQATLGGNICARAGDAPRGDLQAPLIALGAKVVSTGKDGRKRQPIEQFLGQRGKGRLVLAIEYDDVQRTTGYAVALRPHAHHYSILAVCCAKTTKGVRVAVTGAAPAALRCPSVEKALAAGASAADAAAAILKDVPRTLPTDAIASGWYRKRVLPSIAARALAQL